MHKESAEGNIKFYVVLTRNGCEWRDSRPYSWFDGDSTSHRLCWCSRAVSRGNFIITVCPEDSPPGTRGITLFAVWAVLRFYGLLCVLHLWHSEGHYNRTNCYHGLDDSRIRAKWICAPCCSPLLPGRSYRTLAWIAKLRWASRVKLSAATDKFSCVCMPTTLCLTSDFLERFLGHIHIDTGDLGFHISCGYNNSNVAVEVHLRSFCWRREYHWNGHRNCRTTRRHQYLGSFPRCFYNHRPTFPKSRLPFSSSSYTPSIHLWFILLVGRPSEARAKTNFGVGISEEDHWKIYLVHLHRP